MFEKPNVYAVRNELFRRAFLAAALRSFAFLELGDIPAPNAPRLGALAIRKPFAFDPSGALFQARAVGVMARIPSESEFVGVF